MHGEETDQGTGIFHRTEFVGLILTGGLACVETPELFGPRNAGHVGVTPRAMEPALVAIRQNKMSGLGRSKCITVVVVRIAKFRFQSSGG